MNYLIAVRHGQSLWNLEKRFTGWVDVDLTQQGKLEATKSGELIKELGLKIDNFFLIWSFSIKSILLNTTNSSLSKRSLLYFLSSFLTCLYDLIKSFSVMSIKCSNVLHLSICFKNLIPKPVPACAPSINPGISANVISLSS